MDKRQSISAMQDFSLGAPELVCRWRLQNAKLPMAQRHLRALGKRRIQDEPVPPELVAWATQQVEWSLENSAFAHPNGVLMLVVDEQGQAAMTVGDYVPLQNTATSFLLDRAEDSMREAALTGIAPEVLWAVKDRTLYVGHDLPFTFAAATSLIKDLAYTIGMQILAYPKLISTIRLGAMNFEEVFLTSDEHGVVIASDRSGSVSRKYRDGYQKLLLKKK